MSEREEQRFRKMKLVDVNAQEYFSCLWQKKRILVNESSQPHQNIWSPFSI